MLIVNMLSIALLIVVMLSFILRHLVYKERALWLVNITATKRVVLQLSTKTGVP